MRRVRLLVVAMTVMSVVASTACAGGTGSSALRSTEATAHATSRSDPGACRWPMAGQNLARTHATSCDDPDAVGAGTLDRLEQVWFAPTRAEVTGAPAVTDDAVYFGDWSGQVYALDRTTGAPRWTREMPVQPNVYAGQIPSSPSVVERDGEQLVVIASGRTVWALRAADGAPRWSRDLGTPAPEGEDATEIEGSPAVVGDLVVVPTDVHDNRSQRSGIVTLSLADGTEQWRWDPEEGRPPGGCGTIWGSPAIDEASRLVVLGTGSCLTAASWSTYSEAIVGLDLDTGEPRWSYQPRPELNNQDWDFAGAPNLFTIGDRPVVGLGNKDGSYYVVDRSDGSLVWRTEAVRQAADGDGFAFGGFIGATAVAADSSGRLVVAGGTAVGDCPCEHGFDAGTGQAAWQSTAGSGTYGASAAVPGLVFTAGLDQTLRAYDLATGEVRWKHQLDSISASGPSIAGDFLAIGVGFREPGANASPSGGVHGFRVLAAGEPAPTPSSSTVPAGPAVTALRAARQRCVGAPCTVPFTLKDPPEGRRPGLTLEISPDPLRITAFAVDLGQPIDWVPADSPAHAAGATVFAVVISPRDDKPELASIVCVLDYLGSCTGDRVGIPADQYTRISLLALVDGTTPPTSEDGYPRLVTTEAFDPALTPAG